MTASIEIFIRYLGNPGIYQLLVFALLACNFFPIAFNHFVIIFYAQEPEFHCKMPQGWAWHSNASIPIIISNGISKFDDCHMYKDPENHALGNKNCIYGYLYKLTPPEWPIVAEWNLVCNNKSLINIAHLLYFVGCLLGALVSGPLAEKYGRRNIMMCCIIGQMIIGFAIAFIRQFFLFVALRTTLGIFIQALECVTYVLVLELFPPKYRTIAGSTCFFIFSFSMMFLSFLSYSIQHWRYIQLSISLPSIIAVSYFWLVPESLRYLMVSQKLEEVSLVLKKYSWFMATSMPSDVLTNAKAACKHIKLENSLTYDVRDLIKSPTLRRHTLFHAFCWLSTYLMYCSLSLFIPELNSNQYINFFIAGLVEFLSYLAAFVALNKFGRRRPLFILFICSGVLSISSVLVDHLAKSRSATLKFSVALAVMGKMCTSACMSGLYLFSAETFPTIVRTIGIGICAAAKILGALLAPLIQLLGNHTLKAIPVILVGAVSLVAAFVVLMLPETYTKSLPDVIAESEDLGKQKSISPVVDKRSNSTGRVTLFNHPLTPPMKRSSNESINRTESEENLEGKVEQTETEVKKNDSEITVKRDESLKIKAEGTDEPENEAVSNGPNRCVRFLGIDVLDELPQKKISTSSDERRVRFSNVAHDIDGNIEDANGQTSEGSTEAEVVEVAQHTTPAAKPAFSILKKTSQDETEKKRVKSPHPFRKISPPNIGEEEKPEIIENQEEAVNKLDSEPDENENSVIETDCEKTMENVNDVDSTDIELDCKIESVRRRKDSVYELGRIVQSV